MCKLAILDHETRLCSGKKAAFARRRLELTAGAKPRPKAAAGVWSTNRAIRDADRAFREQAEISYQRMVTD